MTRESFRGDIVPYRITKKDKVQLRPGTRPETPGVDVGVFINHHLLRGIHFLAWHGDRMQSWGLRPLPSELQNWTKQEITEVIIEPKKMDYEYRTYRTSQRIRFSKSRVAGDFPKLCTGPAVCVKCKDSRAHWQAHSYASGLTNFRVYNFCLNCTFHPRKWKSGSQLGGTHRCRICGERNPDIILYEESELSSTCYQQIKTSTKNFQVPIHKDCRMKIFDIKNFTVARWWDIPPIVKIEL